MAPGILYVTMQPSSTLPSSHFQDWYNNEHGPLRLRLSPSITNGFRYRAIDLDQPGNKDKDEYMAIYDLPEMSYLNTPDYLKLREGPVQSQRERDIRPDIKINRKNFDFLRESKSETFQPLETLAVDSKEDNIVIAASITLKDSSSLPHLQAWYEEEHLPMLSKIPGWLRSRQFVTSSLDGPPSALEYLNLHEYSASNEYFGPLGKEASSTPRTKDIMQNHVASASRRIFKRFYTFGPAPRCLKPLADTDGKITPYENTAPFARTRTMPAQTTSHGLPAIKSYVLTADNIKLPYRLEGSTDDDAPVIVLVNSILVTWGIWDGFVASFLNKSENKKYRILRYNSRGRYNTSSSNTSRITIDTLASDLIAILDALRIPRAAAAVGVSLGGATVLAAGLKYPNRIAAFLSCDTSASAPKGNAATWGDRIAMAEKEGKKRSSDASSITSLASTLDDELLSAELQAPSESIVGDQLADATASRWFPSDEFQKSDEYKRVRDMVCHNSLEGFKASVQALWEYDYTQLMGAYKGKGMFLVGSEDGKLPGSMKGMAEGLGGGSELVVVQGAGHLPMVERPGEVVDAVVRLLG